jgi:hypothetical protein
VYGWLQRDRRYDPQLIEVDNDGLVEVDTLDMGLWRIPLWFKVSVQRYAGREVEVAVQAYRNGRLTSQIFYGYGMYDVRAVEETGVTVNLVLDMDTQPIPEPGYSTWPEPDGSEYIWLAITITADVLAENQELATYNLEWGYDMLSDFTELIKRELALCSWSETTNAGYSGPDDVLVLAEPDLDRYEAKARLGKSLVVIHSPIEIKPDEERSGGFGRKGRQFQADITVFARDARGLDPKKEYSVDYLGLLMADIENLLNPQATVNKLSGYLYDSDYEMTAGSSDASGEAGPNVVSASGMFTGYKMFYDEGSSSSIPSGNGVLFNFNQPFIEAPTGKKQNDHSRFYVEATDTWHLIGIRCDLAETGSANFSHYTSPDSRTWTEQTELTLGEGSEGDPKFIVYAPHIIENPNYGGGGEKRFLMFFTGVTHQSGSTQKQKIFLSGTDETDLTGWTELNDGDPIYWPGMDDGVYAGGAPWCPASFYDSSWAGACRDPFVFLDAGNWYMGTCCKKNGDTSGQQIGLNKFSGGSTPDFTAALHEATPLYIPNHTGTTYYCEASGMIEVNNRWYLTCVKSTYKILGGDADFIGPPWDIDTFSGQTIGGEGQASVTACELNPDPTNSGRHLLSGHSYSGGGYWYKINDMDFTGISGDGEYPVETALSGITGLVALDEGAVNHNLGWTIEDSEGVDGAFYRQPVWDDQALAAGYDASGMTGNSYIATKFRQWNPGSGLDGYEFADSSRVGYIKSSNFTLTRDRISMMVAGGDTIASSFVALFNAADDRLLFQETGTGDHTLTLREWDVTDIIGMSVYLIIADQGTASGDCIDVDAITEYNSSGRGDSGSPSTPEVNGSKLDTLITI